MRILFRKDGKPYTQKFIHRCIQGLGRGCRPAAEKVIANSRHGINAKIFAENAARLLPVFNVTQRGPFRGIRFDKGNVTDPRQRIAQCWKLVGEDICRIRRLLDHATHDRNRALAMADDSMREEVASLLWFLFKRLLPVCMTSNSLGLSVASKILFCGLPEAAVPIENLQWREVYRTVDYEDVLLSMVAEVLEWERKTGLQLNRCNDSAHATLPSVYGIMAMHHLS